MFIAAFRRKERKEIQTYLFHKVSYNAAVRDVVFVALAIIPAIVRASGVTTRNVVGSVVVQSFVSSVVCPNDDRVVDLPIKARGQLVQNNRLGFGDRANKLTHGPSGDDWGALVDYF